MNEKKISHIERCKTSHQNNNYSLYLSKINNRNNNKGDIELPSQTLTQTEEGGITELVMHPNQRESMTPKSIDNYRESPSKIRFDQNGVLIKKGKPSYHHITFIDQISKAKLETIVNIESFKNNDDDICNKLLKSKNIPSNKRITCCCKIL